MGCYGSVGVRMIFFCSCPNSSTVAPQKRAMFPASPEGKLHAGASVSSAA